MYTFSNPVGTAVPALFFSDGENAHPTSVIQMLDEADLGITASDILEQEYQNRRMKWKPVPLSKEEMPVVITDIPIAEKDQYENVFLKDFQTPEKPGGIVIGRDFLDNESSDPSDGPDSEISAESEPEDTAQTVTMEEHQEESARIAREAMEAEKSNSMEERMESMEAERSNSMEAERSNSMEERMDSERQSETPREPNGEPTVVVVELEGCEEEEKHDGDEKPKKESKREKSKKESRKERKKKEKEKKEANPKQSIVVDNPRLTVSGFRLEMKVE